MRGPLAILVGAGLVFAPTAVDAQPARERVISALEQLMATGRPAHVDHDDGQVLQQQLNALVAAGDEKVLQLARRAAAPLVTHVSHPIARRSGLPHVGVEARQVLDAPASEKYSAHVAVSIDGGRWIPFCEIKPAAGCGRNVDRLSEEAATPGFHRLQFHATIRHENGEIETRTLEPVAYGVMGVASTTPRHMDPAQFMRAAATARASSLAARLPDLTLTDWLRSLHRAGSHLEAALWESQWCGLNTRSSLLELDDHAVCATAFLQVAQTKAVAEIRIRTGRLEWADGVPRWISESPVVDHTFVRGSRSTRLSTLAQLPAVLRLPEADWPMARVSVDPADIAYVRQPGSDAAPGAFIVRATVRNLGDADVYGAVIDLMAVGEVNRGPFLLRQRVIDLPAGASVVFVQKVTYPAAYGTLLVQIRYSGDGSPNAEMLALHNPWDGMAFRVINPRAAPDGYSTSIADAICAHQCRGY